MSEELIPAPLKTVLVTGDRNWTDLNVILRALVAGKRLGFTVLVHGAATGADHEADRAGRGLGFEVRPYEAEWAEHGKRAGVLRNMEMLVEEKPAMVLAFHDDLAHSKGTGHMVEISLPAECVKEVYHYSHADGWKALKG